jgi:serine/threonine protein kinase
MRASVQIGPYQVLRLIKTGGQGRVYLGYDTRLQRKVALKLLPLLHSADARKVQLREARTVASMHSERIVEIYDRVVSRHAMALVMEYVPGCDLEDLLAAGALPLSCVLAIATDVAAALAVARQAHIVHGDLKASNVLLNQQGRAKLTDFGIASSQHGGNSGPEAGSLRALAPEQINGQATDVRTDLFALGCLIYRMLTGVHPFVRNGQWDGAAVLAGEYPEVGSVLPGSTEDSMPKDLELLMRDLLQVSPAQRPGDTHEVRRRLREVSRNLPLVLHASLTDFAAPYFRAESPDEQPADIPLELIEQGRSQGQAGLVQGVLGRTFSRVSLAMSATALLVVAIVFSWLWLAIAKFKPDIEIMDPAFALDGKAQTLLTVYPDAIRAAIAQQVHEESLGVVLESAEQQTGKVAYSRSLPAQTTIADERILSRIECRSQLCILSMQRQINNMNAEPTASFQLPVFADAPPEQWQAAVEAGLSTLYRL